MSTRTIDDPKMVSREEWFVARKKLFAREKQLIRECDAVAAELPGRWESLRKA